MMTRDRYEAPDATADRLADEAADWFARLRRAEVTAADRAGFESWREMATAHAAAYRRVEALWESDEFAAALRGTDVPADSPVATQAPAMYPAVKRRPVPYVAAAIAMLAVLCGVFGVVRTVAIDRMLEDADYRTAVGETERVTLADGSVMQLNTATSVALAMDGRRRGIRLLRGEGYFDVAHDAGRPFEVAAGAVRITVLGTAFAVRRDGDNVVVAVRRGRVSVRLDGGQGTAVTLAAGELLRVVPGRRTSTVSFDEDVAFAWLNGRIVFRDRPLRAVLSRVGRHYDGWILVAGDALGDARVSGDFRLDDPAAIVEALAGAAKGAALHLPGGMIVVH